LREKGLTVRRINALQDIVSENGEMKSDAEVIHNKYKSELTSLDRIESNIKSEFLIRLGEIEEQEKVIKEVLFDAKVQIKSEEITESTFDIIQKHTNNMLERFSHEKAEIDKIQKRIDNLSLEHSEPIEDTKFHIQQSAETYLDSPIGNQVQSQTFDQPATTLPEPESTLPEPPMECANPHTDTSNDSSTPSQSDESDWLSRMQSEQQD